MQMRQKDVGVSYWNKKKNIVETRYCDSKFMRRPNAQNLFDNLQESMTDFDKINLFS